MAKVARSLQAWLFVVVVSEGKQRGTIRLLSSPDPVPLSKARLMCFRATQKTPRRQRKRERGFHNYLGGGGGGGGDDGGGGGDGRRRRGPNIHRPQPPPGAMQL